MSYLKIQKIKYKWHRDNAKFNANFREKNKAPKDCSERKIMEYYSLFRVVAWLQRFEAKQHSVKQYLWPKNFVYFKKDLKNKDEWPWGGRTARQDGANVSAICLSVLSMAAENKMGRHSHQSWESKKNISARFSLAEWKL